MGHNASHLILRFQRAKRPQTFAGMFAVENFFASLFRMKRASIKDLAKALNLSISTISRALTDHPDISERTKQRVREAAEHFHYTPNWLARGFRQQSTGVLALVLPEVNMFFTPKLIEGVNSALFRSGYTLSVFLTNDRLEGERDILQQCLERSVDGVLWSISRETTDLLHAAPLLAANIPCVLLDKTVKDKRFDSVRIDGESTGFLAATHLLEHGHRRLAGIFGADSMRITQERERGFRKALRGFPDAEGQSIHVEQLTDLPEGLERLRTAGCTGWVFMSDELAAHALPLLAASGVAVPDHVSVVAISDGVWPYLVHPQISHVLGSGFELGFRAGMGMVQKLQNKTPSGRPERVLVSTELVELGSVAHI